ncbi:D-arabinitol 4-dehydrogenase [uncultured Thiothrix sp.]|uniref:D-arabinitol 4-dehydrogenase n=1 Tax=uncultured Thiothrix sp. TaxID=223185 RepID=UPI00263696A6|nr:D-arabinitol 4-dehydrogenase [uncultured Thiothrix sp.]HMT94032.1 mannitol dehydrogenase family protein [Thiolinea sp.]
MSAAILTQLHLGLGSFHRAHQAVYMQALHDQGEQTWRIVGGNLRPDMLETVAVLQASHGAYTLETVNTAGERFYQYITAIQAVISWDQELSGLVKVASDPNTRIISFTVTEAGYYLDAHNHLDENFADLRSDLAGQTCSTIYGALSKLLHARMQAGAGKVTLLNCDNLRSNGERFLSGLKQFLAKHDDQTLLAWVSAHTTAPNSMVDRITPRPTPDIRERVKAATGRDDPAALMGETFIQWVVEDHFANGRPAWETVGVEMVKDVMPYEEAKIRLLNATHSCIAWAGTLRGYQYIHQGTLDPEIRQMAYAYVTEDVIPCLEDTAKPYPLNLPKYRDVVLDRFSNPNILDTNQRVAMDGFSKIPGFIQPTLREALDANRSIDAVARLPALFLRFLQRQQRGEIPFKYEDQAMNPASAQAICTSSDPIATFANEQVLFGSIAGNERLIAALRKAVPVVDEFVSKT